MAVWTQLFVLSVLSASLVSAGTVKVDGELLQQLIGSVRTLKTRNEHLEERVKALASVHKRQTNEGPVAFTAKIVPRYVDHVTDQQTVVFRSTVINVGDAYNNATGIFTAPLSGLYIFTSSLLDSFAHTSGTGTKLHGEIMHNGTPLVRVYAHAEPHYRDQGANTVIVSVQKGDSLWVRIVDNSDLTLGGEMYSTFSGYLLWLM